MTPFALYCRNERWKIDWRRKEWVRKWCGGDRGEEWEHIITWKREEGENSLRIN